MGAADLRPRRPGDGRRGGRGGASDGTSLRRADASARSSWPRRSSTRCRRSSMVRLVSSGTEAAMSALRLARGSTRRDRILKFAGCYHGHADALLARPAPAWRRSASRRRPACPPAPPADTIVCPYNDLEAAAAAVARYGEGLACDRRRAGRREHGRRPARARLPRGAARALRRIGRAARLRRGDHRLPRRARRRAGALRRAARPDRARQDRRRRPPARGVRRPRRRDGAAGAGRRRLPGGDAVRKPARDRGRALGPAPAARRRRLRPARGDRRPARGRARRRSATCSGSARC